MKVFANFNAVADSEPFVDLNVVMEVRSAFDMLPRLKSWDS